ncbi:MAG TPA: hypothetical protein VN733_03810 [Solirubrobacterales bacterium]|nr:hypothetical protein [Solirubrobacterales bacterium]
MNYPRMICLAAATSLAMIALGAAPASATTVFTDSAKTVSYPAGTAVHGSLVPGTSSRVTVEGTETATCSSGTIEGKTTNRSAATISLDVSSWWAGNCSEAVTTVATGLLEIGWTSGSNGTVTGKATQKTTLMFGVSCTYGTGEGTDLGSITGGSAPVLKIAALVPKVAGGFLCPSKVGWDDEFEITQPHALFVWS